jgi:hypothetical protein
VLGFPVELVTPDGGAFGSRQVRAAEIPAGNLVTDARSLARAYAATVADVDGIRLLSPATVETARVVQTDTSEPWGLPPGFEMFGTIAALGFQVSTDLFPMLGASCFGHGGAGGSVGCGEVDHQLGFAYVMNQMQGGTTGDPRGFRLIGALYQSLVA